MAKKSHGPVDDATRSNAAAADPAARSPMPGKAYLAELSRLEIELGKLQEWVRHAGLKVVVVFEQIDIPPRQSDVGYVRPPLTDQTFVPELH